MRTMRRATGPCLMVMACVRAMDDGFVGQYPISEAGPHGYNDTMTMLRLECQLSKGCFAVEECNSKIDQAENTT
eukprot:scaffold96826_cov50-Cyclotella_meneghiniana.AAC.1